MNSVAVVDAAWGGHIGTYHQLIVEALSEQDLEVWSYSPRPRVVESWFALRCPNRAHQARFLPFGPWASDTMSSSTTGVRSGASGALARAARSVPGTRSSLRLIRAVGQWKSLGKALETTGRAGPDAVFIPYLDGGFLHPLLTSTLVDRLCAAPWAGLYLHPTHFRKPGGDRRAAGMCRIFSSSHCHAVAVLDEGIALRLQEAVHRPVFRFPDITDMEYDRATALAEQIVTKAAGRTVVSLIGGLTKKKNVVEFLRLARNLNPDRYFFVLAGELITPSFSRTELRKIKSALQAGQSNLITHLELIPDGIQYNALIVASDIIFAIYSDFFHSSNTLTKAALFGKPVIVGDGFLMAERVRKYDLGRVVPAEDFASWIDTLEELGTVCRARNWQRTAPQVEYGRAHSTRALREVLGAIIRTVAG